MSRALQDSKLEKSDIGKIILVGGPTRMPIVLLTVTVGTVGGALGGALGSGVESIGAKIGQLVADRTILGSAAVKYAASKTATAVTALAESATLNVTAQFITTGAVNFDTSFIAALAFAPVAGLSAKSLGSRTSIKGAVRNRIRQRAINNPYVVPPTPALGSGFSVGGVTGAVLPSPYGSY